MAQRIRTLEGLSAVAVGCNYSAEETQFLRAISIYKQANQRPFPTWREVLAVVHSLGYRQVLEPESLPTLQEISESCGG